MWKTLLTSLVTYLLIKVQKVSGNNVSVVEYMYQYDSHLSPGDNLMKNVLAHVNIIRLLKGKTEMVVFPEESLCPGAGSNAVYLNVPSPSYSTSTFDSKALTAISDAAKSSGIYVVFNVAEKSGSKRFSSCVVLRRNGTVAARYRKNHLSGEDLDRPETVELASFDTDFNVKFGLFASNDLLFQSPPLDLVKQGIKFFVYPTAWSSNLPFLVGNQAQQSWSWIHDVTLLAAGLNRVGHGQTGSGIYKGRHGHLTQTPIKYYMSNTPTTMIITGHLFPVSSPPASARENGNEGFNLDRLFLRNQNIATVLSHSSSKDTEYVATKGGGLALTSSSFKGYTTALLSPDNNCAHLFTGSTEFYRCDVLQRICNGDVCCSFDITVDYLVCSNPCLAETLLPSLNTDDSFYLFRYRMAVLDGVQEPWKGGDTLGMQVCAVVPCLDDNVSTCGLKPDPSKYKSKVYNIRGYTAKIWAQSVTSVNITGSFATNSSTMTMPSLFLGVTEPSVTEFNRFGMLSNHFFYESSHNKVQILLPEEIRNLGAVAIVNRVFSRDGYAPRSYQIELRSSLALVVLSTVLYISLS